MFTFSIEFYSKFKTSLNIQYTMLCDDSCLLLSLGERGHDTIPVPIRWAYIEETQAQRTTIITNNKAQSYCISR